MPRFFVPSTQVVAGEVRIVGRDAAHLARALRARAGERLVVVDDAGREHHVVLTAVTATEVAATVERSGPATGEPRLRVHVLQALAQAGIADTVAALSEVGAASVLAFTAERSVARPDPARTVARVERWRTLAREAAGLAGRGAVPEVDAAGSLMDALDALPEGCLVVACVLGAPIPLALPEAGAAAVAVVIGPEGGLSPAELSLLAARGVPAMHLGARVIRSRSAGAIATALLLAQAGDLDVAPDPPDPPGGRGAGVASVPTGRRSSDPRPTGVSPGAPPSGS